jgi:hypothetical protein
MIAQRTAGPGEINYAPFDRYSLAHGLIGIAAAMMGLSFWATLAIAVGWEIVEHFLKNVVPSLFSYASQDTLINSVGDVLSTLVGWALTTVVRQRQQLSGMG